MIEHRHTKRVGVSEKVSIYHRGNLVARCKIKDLSVDGMAIWAGPLQYHRNTMLEVEFNGLTGADDFPREPLRLPAIVVYSSARELGLMFTQTSDLAQELLRSLMNQSNWERRENSWQAAAIGQRV